MITKRGRDDFFFISGCDPREIPREFMALTYVGGCNACAVKWIFEEDVCICSIFKFFHT